MAIIVTVDPGGTGDYVSLNAAESAQQQDLTVTGSEIQFQCFSSDGTADETNLTFDGWTVSPQYYIEIGSYGVNRHEGYWDSNKYRLSKSSGAGYTLNIREQHTYIKYLQIEMIGDFDLFSSLRLNASDTTAEGCILYQSEDEGISTGIEFSSEDGSGSFAFNNIVYGYAVGIVIGSQNTDTAVYNNTVYSCSIGYQMGTTQGTFVAKNNIAQKCVTACYQGGTFDAASDYNLSDDTTSPVSNTNDITGSTVTFQDPASIDFRLVSGDAVDAGDDLSSDSLLEFTTDIVGTTRPQGSAWDMGAYEVVSAGPVVELVEGQFVTFGMIG